MTDEVRPDEPTTCGYVALVGAPNAGKSTLINQLVGGKVSIVSPKVQTTRTRVLGILVEGNSQMILVDTPGIFGAPKRRLERAMVKAAWTGAEEADVVVVVIDSHEGISNDTKLLLENMKADHKGRPVMLALNKIDLIHRPKLLSLAQQAYELFDFSGTYMISASNGDGVDDLRGELATMMPEGPWLYPEDQLADTPMRLLAAEFTREQLFLKLHEELPYSLTVETESWKEMKDGSARIDQVIFIERESQKAIVIGAGGRMIKMVGEAARAQMSAAFEKSIHLFLHVKVREGWSDERERYRDLGLDYDV
ncbi:GTPase Era [Lacibacterium aquatile]|uniref:GTPase Era n=1 Tax=Lacibacterium aquatile TaxID=1168082 RepID=A0ABW5DML1_9PROT